eukprot:4406644-Amphidinium_carterae.1
MAESTEDHMMPTDDDVYITSSMGNRYPRLKARPPQRPPLREVPAPGDPQFADFVHSILTTGHAPAQDNTMETDDEPQVINADGSAAAQSISSNASTGSTMDGQTMVSLESMMWDSI